MWVVKILVYVFKRCNNYGEMEGVFENSNCKFKQLLNAYDSSNNNCYIL